MELIHEGPFDSFIHFLSTPKGILCIVQFLAAGFIFITFLQSGLDKLFNYKENLSWMSAQFSKTFLAKSLPLFLPVILLGELISAGMLLIGIFQLCTSPKNEAVMGGLFFSGIVLLLLLFGQRVSKEYAGAASLTGYFALVLIGLIAGAFYA